MKFYPISTPDGPQLVGTQEEAKKAGVKRPQPVEYPTDKEGLMRVLNELMSAAAPNTTSLDIPPDLPPLPDDIIAEDTAEKAPLSKWSAEAVIARMDGKACPTCGHDPKAVRAGKLLGAGVDQDRCIEFILDKETPPFAVGNIVGAIIERLEANE